MDNERQHRILEILRQQNFASVDDLCRTLYSSGATIRRDLTELENRGMIKRVRGGAIAFNGINSDLPFLLRSNRNVEEKKRIAQLAVQFVNESTTLFMDSSSTSLYLAHELTQFQNVSVITNCIDIAYMLSIHSNAKVYASGGQIRNSTTMVGPTALSMVNNRFADLFFFSCAALSVEHGATETNEDSVAIKRAMYANSGKRILLCDHTKFGSFFSYRCFDLDSLDIIITDRKPPEEFLRGLPASIQLRY